MLIKEKREGRATCCNGRWCVECIKLFWLPALSIGETGHVPLLLTGRFFTSLLFPNFQGSTSLCSIGLRGLGSMGDRLSQRFWGEG